MPSMTVNFAVKARNSLTRFGREKNHLYKQMKDAGYAQIIERNLPNGSTLALGYRTPQSKTNEIAFMLNKDLSLVQKMTEKSKALVSWLQTSTRVLRQYANRKGDITRIKDVRSDFINGELYAKSFSDKYIGKSSTNKMYNKYGNAVPREVRSEVPSADIIKSIHKSNEKMDYYLLQHSDGKMTYIKDFGGQRYTFTSK